ncbi:MAG: sigma-54 dependent transcriptional regulator [Candidatus Hydrogenedentes bacterium]|nr:sigma-54 dependent transcriptional regulator [Candidatus Hydrogenedentota bacterium]
MKQFEKKLWKEVAKHDRLDKFIINIIPECLKAVKELLSIEVLFFNTKTQNVEIFHPPNCPIPHINTHILLDMSPFASDELIKTSVRDKVFHSRKKHTLLHEILTKFYYPNDIERVLYAPLYIEQSLSGLLVGIFHNKTEITHYLIDNFSTIIEPFNLALANHQRIFELELLRKAEEAEKIKLLRKLGRENLPEKIIGERTGLKTVMDRVHLVAQSDIPVLILGETGTGKELIAREIHRLSPRCAGPIIRVNCGAIPSELVDSQLFGHEKGSFTGAIEKHIGWFERADGGTLFLDEIGELPTQAQVRLLRILQDGWLERVGGREPVHVDVRLVTATNADLAQMVAEKKFREDLFYRISTFPIVLPPLRERKEDIPELARYFAEKSAQRFSLPVIYPSDKDIELLCEYSWPGNVRELSAVIDRAVILGNGKKLEIAKALGLNPSHSSMSLESTSDSYPKVSYSNLLPLDEYMKHYIIQVLKYTKGKVEGKGGCAEILKVNPNTLRAKMRKLNINWREIKNKS